MRTDIFRNGACFVRADFHLHTCADKEFIYTQSPEDFADQYVARLVDAGIRVGVITNHNKFDFSEYQGLAKRAMHNGVFLLPGVELSVGEGKSGVHVLVVFDSAWIADGEDRINKFIASQFQGCDARDYQKENARSANSLIQTVNDLDKYGRQYFLVFAHVEDAKGLWAEMPTRMRDWNRSEWNVVKRRTLAFQKVRTFDASKTDCPERIDKAKIVAHIGTESYPAEVEGSDPKSLDDVGKGKHCYIKIGEFSFEAVRFALESRDLRVKAKVEDAKHSYIKSVAFSGGVLDGERIDFSPQLNALIGVRGSGKSSLIESIRFALQISTGDGVIDEKYKKDLVRHTLGSSGKIDVEAVDAYGQTYVVSRTFGDHPEVFRGGERQPAGISICDVVVRHPLCFGQKELSAREDGSEDDLVERLIGPRLSEIRNDIRNKQSQIRVFLSSMGHAESLKDKVVEVEAKVKTLETQLKIYKSLGLEKQLQEKTDLNHDHIKLELADEAVALFVKDLKNILEQKSDDLRELAKYEPKQAKDFWQEYLTSFSEVLAAVAGIERDVQTLAASYDKLHAFLARHEKIIGERKDEFAAVERELYARLVEKGYQAVRPDDYVRFEKQLAIERQTLVELQKTMAGLDDKQAQLLALLAELSELYRQEHIQACAEIRKINEQSTSMQIKYEFRGDRAAFRDYISGVFRGSRIRNAAYDKIVDEYPDFIQIYRDKEGVKKLIGDMGETFISVFTEHRADLLLWQTPNKTSITFNGTPLSSHSLGQRASALILFVMGLRENDIVIIDQPEDDLDSQTIYEDVIKLVVKLKPSVQFIFATHNANIPVLGDAEQVIACRYDDATMKVECGGIDVKSQQRNIVSIMEGGNEAFKRRREIYGLWNEAN